MSMPSGSKKARLLLWHKLAKTKPTSKDLTKIRRWKAMDRSCCISFRNSVKSYDNWRRKECLGHCGNLPKGSTLVIQCITLPNSCQNCQGPSEVSLWSSAESLRQGGGANNHIKAANSPKTIRVALAIQAKSIYVRVKTAGQQQAKLCWTVVQEGTANKP